MTRCRPKHFKYNLNVCEVDVIEGFALPWCKGLAETPLLNPIALGEQEITLPGNGKLLYPFYRMSLIRNVRKLATGYPQHGDTVCTK